MFLYKIILTASNNEIAMTGALCFICISFANCPIMGLSGSSDVGLGCGMCKMKMDTQLELVPDHKVGTVVLTKTRRKYDDNYISNSIISYTIDLPLVMYVWANVKHLIMEPIPSSTWRASI